MSCHARPARHPLLRLVPLAVLLLAGGLTACGGSGSDDTASDDTAPGGASASTSSSASTEQGVDASFVESSRAATNRLQVALKKELSAAMQEGGPVAAIEVCRTRAQEITAEVAAETEREVRRVSRRERNPLNAASETEAAVLARFAARPDLADTSFVQGGQPVYMRAIRIGSPLCLNCHGPREQLEQDVVAVLDRHYPEDEATGFASGDLRGAFVVR